MSPVAVLLTRLLAVEKEPFRAQGSHRQPGRDRRPRRARLPRCGSRQRRRLRPARSGCTACPRGGRGLRARRSVGRGKLSGHREDPQGGGGVRRRCRTPRVRLPGGERALRPRGDRRRADLDRAAARGDRGTGRQDCRAGDRPQRGGAAGAWYPGPGLRPGRGCQVRRRARPAHRDQGRLRRRRARAQGRAHARRDRGAVRVGCPRGRRGLRPRRVFRRALPGPAPFLTGDQETVLRESSKAILREVGYVGAGTCEFLVGQDGTVSFLEVNTRLQVEHPVTEEVSGIDLVLEMFRIADGQELGYSDPPHRGHSIEFRINAEDPGGNFLPAPGTVTEWSPPSGPGVRVDAGYTRGMTVPQAFDSLIAKLIVTGASRQQALERARRALDEFVVGGMPTVLPFHRAVVRDPAFTAEPFTVHTRWIETEFAGQLPSFSGLAAQQEIEPQLRERITFEVAGKRLEVVLPAGLLAASPGGAGPGVSGRPTQGRRPGGGRQRTQRRDQGGRSAAGRADGDDLARPMPGTIIKIVAREGDRVAAGDTVVVLEAMKMEQPLTAHKDGTVTGLAVEIGQTISAGGIVCQLKD